MQVLLDINVVLDHLLARSPWAVDGAAIWQAAVRRQLRGFVTATTMTNLFYIARRTSGLTTANQAVRLCLDTFQICTVDRATLESADVMSGNDFEDNVQIACAVENLLDAIVTRDATGFRTAPVPAWTPAELLQRL